MFPAVRNLLLALPLFLFGGPWAEETLARMTLEEKIGQLFIAPLAPLRGPEHQADWERLIREFHIGGLILKQSDPTSQVERLSQLQALSPIPLLVCADAEWGLSMRMTETVVFPKNRTLGALADPSIIYDLGREIGRQAKRVGVHLSLAPVADVNCNPLNPVIGMRSFGEDPLHVAECVSLYLHGLQDAGIFACAKHFPGHGDTSVDSHIGLPLIPHPKTHLEEVELVPFRRAVQEGVYALMTAHILVPAIDPVYPASLSKACIQVAREELSFSGLIVSDALNMKALTDRFSIEKVALLAHEAGTDLLSYGAHLDPEVDALLKESVPRAFRALQEAYLAGTLSLERLDASVLRILEAKEAMGLAQTPSLSLEGLKEDLLSPEALALRQRLFREAVTLLGEASDLSAEAAYVSVGEGDVLQRHFAHVFPISATLSRPDKEALLEELQAFPQVVFALHQASPKAERFGFSSDLLALIEEMGSILCLFATPYALETLPQIQPTVLGYENDPEAQEAVWQVLQGRMRAIGVFSPLLLDDAL